MRFYGYGRHCGGRSACEDRGYHGGYRGRRGFMGRFGGFMNGPGIRAARMIASGDLQLIILALLSEKPRHGYEIIKSIEEHSSGIYTPSPGVVYPTLTMLEDLGYARAMPEEGGRKIYEITDAGRKHLEEHSATVDDIFERIAKFVEGFFDAPMADLKRSMASLGRATFYVASRSPNDRERLAKISEILKKAAADIEKLTQEGGDTSSKSEAAAQP